MENLAYALPISYFPQYVQLLGAPIVYLGLFTAAFTVANATLSQRLGSLSDRVDRKRLIQIGLLYDVALACVRYYFYMSFGNGSCASVVTYKPSCLRGFSFSSSIK